MGTQICKWVTRSLTHSNVSRPISKRKLPSFHEHNTSKLSDSVFIIAKWKMAHPCGMSISMKRNTTRRNSMVNTWNYFIHEMSKIKCSSVQSNRFLIIKYLAISMMTLCWCARMEPATKTSWKAYQMQYLNGPISEDLSLNEAGGMLWIVWRLNGRVFSDFKAKTWICGFVAFENGGQDVFVSAKNGSGVCFRR